MIIIIIYCSKLNIEKFTSTKGYTSDDKRFNYSDKDIERLSGCILVDNNILRNHFDSQIDPSNDKCIISNKGVNPDDPNFIKQKFILKRMTRNACNMACFNAYDTNKACFFGTKADGNLEDGEFLEDDTIRFKFCKEPIT